MNEVSIGFKQFFDTFTRTFYYMYVGGQKLWEFFTTDLSVTFGSDGDFLGELLNYTPIELMFSFGLVWVLMVALVKFFTGIFSV